MKWNEWNEMKWNEMKWNKKYKILVIFCQDIICKFTNIYFNPKTQHKCNAQFKYG